MAKCILSVNVLYSFDPERLHVFYGTANGSGRLDVEIDGEFFNVQPILDKGITVTLVGTAHTY